VILLGIGLHKARAIDRNERDIKYCENWVAISIAGRKIVLSARLGVIQTVLRKIQLSTNVCPRLRVRATGNQVSAVGGVSGSREASLA